MSNFFVVDANGNNLKGELGLSKVTKATKSHKVARPVLRRSPKMADLLKLEDAIFAHGEHYRVPFLNLITVTKADPNPDPEFNRDEFYTTQCVNHLESRKTKALRHCWEKLNWRPRDSGLSVYIKNPANPYTKDK